MTDTEHRVAGPDGPLSAVLAEPDDPVALLVFAHGAGAGYRHASMEAISAALAATGIATFRFNFPFTEAGRRRVDGNAVSIQTIGAALAGARELRPDLALFAGGHSYGGRMTSHAVAPGDADYSPSPALDAVRGLVFCSFPLHGAKKPSVKRAAHLPSIALPMLFLSGTRDDLADPDLLEETASALPRAELQWLETANHSYQVLKRTRRSPLTVFEEMAGHARAFVDRVLAEGSRAD